MRSNECDIGSVRRRLSSSAVIVLNGSDDMEPTRGRSPWETQLRMIVGCSTSDSHRSKSGVGRGTSRPRPETVSIHNTVNSLHLISEIHLGALKSKDKRACIH